MTHRATKRLRHSANQRQRLFLQIGCAALALFGLLLHNGREFGPTALLTDRKGESQITVLRAGLLVLWWRAPRLRFVASIALVGLAVVNLVAGALRKVVPLGYCRSSPSSHSSTIWHMCFKGCLRRRS